MQKGDCNGEISKEATSNYRNGLLEQGKRKKFLSRTLGKNAKNAAKTREVRVQRVVKRNTDLKSFGHWKMTAYTRLIAVSKCAEFVSSRQEFFGPSGSC